MRRIKEIQRTQDKQRVIREFAVFVLVFALCATYGVLLAFGLACNV